MLLNPEFIYIHFVFQIFDVCKFLTLIPQNATPDIRSTYTRKQKMNWTLKATFLKKTSRHYKHIKYDNFRDRSVSLIVAIVGGVQLPPSTSIQPLCFDILAFSMPHKLHKKGKESSFPPSQHLIGKGILVFEWESCVSMGPGAIKTSNPLQSSYYTAIMRCKIDPG